jgi:hypothetical protein
MENPNWTLHRPVMFSARRAMTYLRAACDRLPSSALPGILFRSTPRSYTANTASVQCRPPHPQRRNRLR